MVSKQISASVDSIPGDSDTKNKILAQRRCIILAIVGATPSSNTSLALILQNGFLSTVKSWLDDILNGSVGELVLYKPPFFTFLRHISSVLPRTFRIILI